MYDSRLTSLVDDGCGMAWPVDIADVTNYMRVRKKTMDALAMNVKFDLCIE